MNLINTLGWTLVHFLWQGTLIALTLGAVHGLLRHATARARYVAACGAMLLMLVCVATTFARMNAQASPAVPVAAPAEATSALPEPFFSTGLQAGAQGTADFSGLLPWLVYFWMAGVCLLTLRSLGGWMAVQGFKRRQARPVEPVWQRRLAQLAQRLRISRPVQLCESTLAQVPAVIGWIRPVILMPVCALNGLTPEQLEGLLAHELAHIRQNDYLVNLFQTCVETLLFYHPAVWWVGNRIRAEREHCCDDLAVEVCGDALAYAKALTQLEQIRGSAPRLAMAATGGSLLRRVQRLLSSRPAARVAPAGWMAGAALALVVAAAWATPRLAGANANPGDEKRTSAATTDHTSSAAIEAARETIDRRATEVSRAIDRSVSGISGAIDRRASNLSKTIEPTLKAILSQSPPTDPRQQPASPDNPSEPKGTSFLEEMDKAGYHNLSVDQLIALKIHGVNAEFIRDLRAEGLQPTPDQLVALKIHGVTPQYIDHFRSRDWKLDIDHLVALRIHGVDPADLDKMSAQGYKLDPDRAVAMRIHGLTPEFAAHARELGLGEPTFEQLLALKIHGADQQFLAGMKGAGIRGLDFNTLVALKIHGADPEQLKQFAELGFKDLSAEEVVAARIHGVTPEFIREIRKRGFKDLTLEQIIKLKQFGILDKQGSL
jgi:beta-lactamase regulating signal transducer with metallopeptidase domain